MNIPTSTYRLQLRNGMSFEGACGMVDYWKRLGISHLYLSPICTATTDSTHGYDVTNAEEVDPAIGGLEGFERLAGALKSAGIGIILDIVPNHMAASLENHWWLHVLEHGVESPYASTFDIDWNERLTLPVLGGSFEEVLASGDLSVVYDEVRAGLAIGYYDNLFPLRPDSAAALLQRVDDFRASTLAALSENHDFIRELHDQQHWRLMSWREAAGHLSYRRFFEVTGLVGVRVEDPEVFEAIHRLPLDLVARGLVQGLRIDHVDGLADPEGYLQRLRKAVGPDIYVIVEKILGHGEKLPESWPVEGTTGYEFIAALPDAFVDAAGLGKLDQHYRKIAGAQGEFANVLSDAKSMMVNRNFAGEVKRLCLLAAKVDDSIHRDDIADAIRGMLVEFPVYRTYGTDGELGQQDQRVLDGVMMRSKQKARSDAALQLIAGILRGEILTPDAIEFRTRFQQLTGPVMAKAMEDTSFYRYNRLIALNEVGGEPATDPAGLEAFHAFMQDRLQTQPYGLSATSTHDTKRGEDARARLYGLSEGAEAWAAAVARWSDMNRHLRVEVDGTGVPGPDVEWLIYQALAGAWPSEKVAGNQPFIDRMTAYVEKALREAKLRTDWAAQDPDYELAIMAYIRALLAPENHRFVEDFSLTLQPFIDAGHLNGLSQTLIKLTAPGIPDIYQGSEAEDFSLVDPDNRRVPDFETLKARLETQGADLSPATLKQRMIVHLLHFRNRYPSLFASGAYIPLAVEGERRSHVLAFARQHEADFVISIAPRLMFGSVQPGGMVAAPGFWANTAIILPEALKLPKMDLVTGESIPASERLLLTDMLGGHPFRCLAAASADE